MIVRSVSEELRSSRSNCGARAWPIEQARHQVGLRCIGRSERKPETQHREQAARHEQDSGDDEQDQRRAVAIARPDAESVDERAGDAYRPADR